MNLKATAQIALCIGEHAHQRKSSLMLLSVRSMLNIIAQHAANHKAAAVSPNVSTMPRVRMCCKSAALFVNTSVLHRTERNKYARVLCWKHSSGWSLGWVVQLCGAAFALRCSLVSFSRSREVIKWAHAFRTAQAQA